MKINLKEAKHCLSHARIGCATCRAL